MGETIPNLSADASHEMQMYRDELTDAIRLANGSYDDISTQDVVAVLRHRANLFEVYGVDALHQRTLPDDYEPLDGLLNVESDGHIQSTPRRAFNLDVAFKTGIVRGQTGGELGPDQMRRVLTCVAEYVEKHGRTALGSRQTREE